MAGVILLFLGLTYAELRMAGYYDGEERMLRRLILWGSLLKALMVLGGMAALGFGLFRLSRKLDLFTGLFRPLEGGDYAGLTALPEPEDADAKAVRDSLVVLGKILRDLRAFILQCLELRDILCAENTEQNMMIGHIGGIIDKAIERFYDVESSVNQALEAMGGIGTSLYSLKDAAGGQSRFMEQAEDRLSETMGLVVSLASRLEVSSKNTESLGLAMTDGETRVQELADIIKNIAGDVEKIAEITVNINQISEQTNILSINAAIESAHASAAGAGFAVVAAEIKKLAESTRENARRIQEELRDITEKTQNALRASEVSSQTFNAITGEIKNLGENLKGLTQSALSGGGAKGDIELFIKNSADKHRRISDGSLDVMAHHQSFETALGLIRDMTEKTRMEIREIHSGTREILEKVNSNQQSFLKSLEHVQAIPGLLPGPNAPGGNSGGTDFDQRGVAVKQPPQIIP
jgi:methyl-accepting chemotaxis protein